MENELLSPGDWVSNDFCKGDRIVVRDYGFCTVIAINNLHCQNLRLLVDWDDKRPDGFIVSPNLQWIGLL